LHGVHATTEIDGLRHGPPRRPARAAARAGPRRCGSAPRAP
jgi:hypothetical protein